MLLTSVFFKTKSWSLEGGGGRSGGARERRRRREEASKHFWRDPGWTDGGNSRKASGFLEP